MSTAAKFFRTAMASDVPSRLAQQKALSSSGTNKVSHGSHQDGNKTANDKKSFIVGKTVVGGDEVVE